MRFSFALCRSPEVTVFQFRLRHPLLAGFIAGLGLKQLRRKYCAELGGRLACLDRLLDDDTVAISAFSVRVSRIRTVRARLLFCQKFLGMIVIAVDQYRMRLGFQATGNFRQMASKMPQV